MPSNGTATNKIIEHHVTRLHHVISNRRGRKSGNYTQTADETRFVRERLRLRDTTLRS